MQEEPDPAQSDSHDSQEGTDDIDDNVLELLPAVAKRFCLGAARLAVRLDGGEAFLPCTLLIALRCRFGNLCACVVWVEDLLPLTTR